ncbi:MAG TPA: erythromycin esterase family protein [Chloroflexia bacterium]|nr:erythromycin esterase family protein [Chloroflexia bacterium]
MVESKDRELVAAVQRAARPLTGASSDYDPLLERIGDARFVLIGEASHGTHEFYRERAALTRRLITEKGFGAVVVEADWPDAYRINCYVRAAGEDREAIEALDDFKRFPAWMWRNADVLDFIGWLRDYNDSRPAGAAKVGYYGMDLYSLHTSVTEVLSYLDRVDPEAASRARFRYGCFDHFGEDTQAYGHAASFGLTTPCQDEVITQLVELQRRATEYAGHDGRVAEDDFFYAEQNARLVKNAEEYYRSMFAGRVSSWNLRDSHMAETLDALVRHLDRQYGRTRIVVWAHNSHLGDARATQMGDGGELNVGQLMRQGYGSEAVLVGFSTYTGTVTAASDWDGPAERKRVRPGMPGSYEALFHETGLPCFLLPLTGDRAYLAGLRQRRLERAIGVIYRPQTERVSHYFHASLPEQFDAMIYFDETRAVEPLEVRAAPAEEVPETYPSSL